jgi:3'(2'), 5'-bisphosphate nucleotidase
LDGTKEFISHNGEFTVNIALIHRGKPVLGIVTAPVHGLVYLGAEGLGACRLVQGQDFETREELVERLHDSAALPRLPLAEAAHPGVVRVVASRSHCGQETLDFIHALEELHGNVERISKGSSLKICLLAEGSADVYPRLGPTMEWDVAAAQAVAEAAGCRITDFRTHEPLRFNKPNLSNPFFVGYAASWQ